MLITLLWRSEIPSPYVESGIDYFELRWVGKGIWR